MLSTIETKTKTSSQYGEQLVNSFSLETKVKPESKKITGSDQWINLVMNPLIERTAISRFKSNLINTSNLPKESIQLDRDFDRLLTEYLTQQYLFCLSENGCHKHLQIQPDYHFAITKDDQGIFVSPTDLSQFGDLSHKYIETNPRVGQGLNSLYQQFAINRTEHFASAIVSPSEEYQVFGSDWDVINLMIETDHQQDTSFATGKYLICKRVLNITERRFLHNLFFGLSQEQFSLSELTQLNSRELTQQVQTAELLTHNLVDSRTPEHQLLVEYPNTFKLSQSETDLFSLALQLNQIFELRFGESLFEDKDISMYPIIAELVEEYLPMLKQQLLSGQDDKYRATLRQLIYHCQAIWASHQQPAPEIIDTDWLSPYAKAHMDDLIKGTILAGFEFGTSSITDSFNTNLFGDFNFNFSNPLGFEFNKYCQLHGEYNREHHQCPKCSHKSTD